MIPTEKEVTDLALATYLSVIGHRLIFTPKSQYGKKTIFVFQGSKKLEADILDFYNRVARVDPLSFAEVFRNLKALVL